MIDLDAVQEQERSLVFDRFDEGVAFDLGMIAYKNASEAGLAIAIDVRTWDRQLLFLSLPGATANQANGSGESRILSGGI